MNLIIILLIINLSGCFDSIDQYSEEDTLNYNLQYKEFLDEYHERHRFYNENINKSIIEENCTEIIIWCQNAINELYQDMNKLYDYNISNNFEKCREYSINEFNYIFDAYRDLINGCAGGLDLGENSNSFDTAQDKLDTAFHYNKLAYDCWKFYN